MFLQPGRMVLSPEPMCNWGPDWQGTQTAQQEHKAPSITHKEQPRATGWTNNSFCLETKLPSWLQNWRLPVTQRRFLPACHMRQSPSVPIVSTTFPKQKPSQLAGCPGRLPLLRTRGKQGKHQLPATLWVSDVTAGIWPVLVPPSCSFGELHHGIKVQTQAWKSCMEKWTRIAAASLQCCLEPRRGEEWESHNIFPTITVLRRKSSTVRNAMLIGKWDDKELYGHCNPITQSPGHVGGVPTPPGAETGPRESTHNFSNVFSALWLFPVLFTSKNSETAICIPNKLYLHFLYLLLFLLDGLALLSPFER